MSTAVISAVVGLVLIAGIWIYNRLVASRNIVAEAWAGIDVQLQKRHELVPNLVAAVRAYAHHETGALEKVTRIRGAQDQDIESRGEQETSLSRSLGRLFALAEAYPQLKASEGFQQLHSSLVEIEDQLQYARRYYNGAVRDNNNLVERFPSNLVARLFRFSPERFFEVELTARSKATHVGL